VVFADGVLEIPSQTASLTRPYRNTGRSGDLLFDPARFAELDLTTLTLRPLKKEEFVKYDEENAKLTGGDKPIKTD
jgi:hypothetical protein